MLTRRSHMRVDRSCEKVGVKDHAFGAIQMEDHDEKRSKLNDHVCEEIHYVGGSERKIMHSGRPLRKLIT